MSVLIKGIKKPKDCDSCEFDGVVNCHLWKFMDSEEEIHHECPIVDVKTPHGRLIDADALVPDICHDWNGWRVPPDDYSEECIRNAPTVIEVEVE